MPFTSIKAALIKKGGFDIAKIEKAFLFAKKAHQGQIRKSGKEYIVHPVAVARQLIEAGADETTVIAALLHDTIEDTHITKAEITHEFGAEIATLVDGMTKFAKNAFEGRKDFDEKVETIRKWLAVMSVDVRIAIIKLLDRLDNIKTLEVFPNPQKRMRIAQETLDIYSRVAEWLSLQNIKYDLECNALKYILDEPKYREMLKMIERRNNRSKEVCRLVEEKYRIQKNGIRLEFDIFPLAIQESCFKNHYPAAIYCITETEEDCYRALSFFHGNWRRRKNSFEDYINTPRVNGYQTLHTTVVFENGEEADIRIMTQKMRDFHEKGVMTYCFRPRREHPELPWIQKLNELLTTNKEKSFEFWNGIKSDLLEGFIIVHGPNDSIISLPRKSTYLDAALAALGKEAMRLERIVAEKGAVTFRQRIEDGEKVDFVLGKEPTVSFDWLQDVDNSQSIRLIKETLREKKQSEKVRYGKELLQEEFDKYNLGLVDELDEKTLLIACKDLEISSLSELFQKIGEVSIFPSEVINRIAPQKVEQKNSAGKTTHLRCQVMRDSIPSFYRILGKHILSARLKPTKKRTDMYDAGVELMGNIEDKNAIIVDIRRAEGMRVIRIENKTASYWVLFTAISLLWGMDPIFAHLLVQTTPISPIALTLIRFAAVTFVLGIAIIVIKLSQQTSSQKTIPFFQPGLLFISLCLLGVSICTYSALVYTTPSNYLLSLYIFGAFLSFNRIIKQKDRLLMVIASITLIVGFLILYSMSSWSNMGKLWTLGAVVCWSLYPLLSEYYQKKYKILSRYIQFQFIISVYCLLFTLAFLSFAPWPQLGIRDYILVTLFSIIFPSTPYLLYHYLVKKFEDISYISYRSMGTVFVTLTGEMLLLHIFPSSIKTISIILMLFGAGVLFHIQKKSQ